MIYFDISFLFLLAGHKETRAASEDQEIVFEYEKEEGKIILSNNFSQMCGCKLLGNLFDKL